MFLSVCTTYERVPTRSRHAFPPSHDTLVFVCGLPAMYASLCGPREDKVLRDGTVLARLGYRSDNVCKL